MSDPKAHTLIPTRGAGMIRTRMVEDHEFHEFVPADNGTRYRCTCDDPVTVEVIYSGLWPVLSSKPSQGDAAPDNTPSA